MFGNKSYSKAIVSFLEDRRGTFAIWTALFSIPLMLAVGFVLDFGYASRERANLQDIADGAVLAAASSDGVTSKELRKIADQFIASHAVGKAFKDLSVDSFQFVGSKIDLSLSANSETSFMALANIRDVKVAVNAAATRGGDNSIEIALVMDNTWSMSEADSKGVTKIQGLKTAAKSLVDSVMSSKVKISLVPYSEQVNVNKNVTSRSSEWLDVPRDNVVPGVCYPRSSGVVCKKSQPMPCYRDGVLDASACSCLEWDTTNEVITNYCTNSVVETWHGCVGMRYDPKYRTNDLDTSVKVPGYVDRYSSCLSPIQPLGTSKSKLKEAIDSMVINQGSFRPETYIPLGLIWGLHTLSSDAPFTEGAPYSLDNKAPRKVVVLMSDGYNTQALKINGAPINPIYLTYSPTEQRQKLDETNSDMLKICDYIKSKNIEIFTIAFMVDNANATTLMKKCSSDPQSHHFDAANSSKLNEAFRSIAKNVARVVLVK
jgi:Flp pilus assembly protein TadG